MSSNENSQFSILKVDEKNRVPTGQGKRRKAGKGAVFRKSQGKPGKSGSYRKISQKSGKSHPTMVGPPNIMIITKTSALDYCKVTGVFLKSGIIFLLQHGKFTVF